MQTFLKRAAKLSVTGGTAVLLVGWAVDAGATIVNVTQTFDSASSAAAAGWAASTMTSGNNFGFSNTSVTTGSAGEAGGIFARTGGSDSASYYADLTLGGTFNRATDTLTLAGLMKLDNANLDGGWGVGFFNTSALTTNSFQFVGLLITEPSPATGPFRAYGAVKNPGSTLTLTGQANIPQNVTTNFSLTWTPTTGGAGTLSGTIAGTAVSVAVGAGGGSYNAFGLVSLMHSPSSSNPSLKTDPSYFDNLTYSTTIPEPSTILLLVLGSGLLLRWSRRRR